MGRGARTPAWLEQLGYPRPAEERVQVDVTYASVLLRIPAETLWEKLVLIGAEPGRPRAFALFGYEDGTRMFTVAGMASDRPPTERDRMVEWAEAFAPPHVLAAVREADLLSEVVTHRFPASQWRRYDKMRRFPDGLLVFGDAISSFNPLYGQGMSVAALEAHALAGCLRAGDRDLPRRFFRAAAKHVAIAWQLATSADLALPEVPGPRPLPVRIGNAIIERYLRAAERDGVVSEQFVRVTSLVDPPTRLFRPRMVSRVIMDSLRRGRASSAVASPEPVEVRP
jgi:2-polyprenyl-6-methoxyphenol hydroxylase-like FAD-dependent oxidoreductase